VIKIKNCAAAFSQALPNGLRYEVIKNMNEKDDIKGGSDGRAIVQN